jgi:uncharacterized protein (DUF2345 family)
MPALYPWRIAAMLRKKFSRGLNPVLVLFAVALLMSDTPAAAQQETVLHNFNGSAKDGVFPYARLISDGSGNLYGTTLAGLEMKDELPLIRVDDAHAGVSNRHRSWKQLEILRDLNTQGGDSAGSSVAISGNTVVVGAPMYTGQGGGAGAVYVFQKAALSGNFTQVATLQSVEQLHLWSFGQSVAITGDTVVVGAAFGNNTKGAAYVFVKPKSGWHDMSRSANLIASDQQSFASLGASVAISRDTIVVGAPGQGVGGAIYVFVKPKSGWRKMTQTAELTVSTAANNDGLGGAVSISGDTIVAGASGVTANTGAAYIFLKPASGWITTSTFNAELTSSDSQLGDSFGLSLITDGSTAVVGAPGALTSQGSAYVFSKPVTGWTTTSAPNARLTASDGASGDRFGSSMAVGGRTAMVGAPSNSPSGAAYVFVEPSSGWKSTSKFSAKLVGASGSALGSCVVLQGKIAIVGAPNDNSGLGAAYVFGH